MSTHLPSVASLSLKLIVTVLKFEFLLFSYKNNCKTNVAEIFHLLLIYPIINSMLSVVLGKFHFLHLHLNLAKMYTPYARKCMLAIPVHFDSRDLSKVVQYIVVHFSYYK